MSWRGTLALLVLAVLAIVAVPLTRRSHVRSEGESLLSFSAPDVKRIVISEGGSVTTLERIKGIWMIAGESPDRADPSMVGKILETARSTEPLDTLKSSELKGSLTPAALGLKKPGRSLTIDDGRTHTLHFGVEGASRGKLYARTDSGGDIHLVSEAAAIAAFRPKRELRDPSLTMLRKDRIQEITLSKQGEIQQLRLIRNPNSSGWCLQSPLSADADEKAVTSWIGAILESRVDRWMPETAETSDYGTETPSERISLLEEGASSPVTISVGKDVPESPGKVYVRCSDRPGVCIVTGLKQTLAMGPKDLRSHRVRAVEYDTVDRIEILKPPAGTILTRKSGSEDWNLLEGNVSTQLPGKVVKEWFSKLGDLSANRFEPATPERINARGMNPPPVTIRLVARLSENSAEEQAGDIVLATYAFGSDSGGETCLREGDSTDLMILPTEALREVKAGPVPATPSAPVTPSAQ